MISQNRQINSLEKNDYIYHKTNGIGKVEEVNGDKVKASFLGVICEFSISNDLGNSFYYIDSNGVCIHDDTLLFCMPKDKELIVDVDKIGEHAFKGNEILENIYLRNVQVIDNGAFEDCVNLTSVTLSKIKTINSEAFKGCTRLNEIFIPRTVNSIAPNAFEDNTLLVTKNPETKEVLTVLGYKNVYFDSKNKKDKKNKNDLKNKDDELSKLVLKDNYSESEKKSSIIPKFVIVLICLFAAFVFYFRNNISNYYRLLTKGYIDLENGIYSGTLDIGEITGQGEFTFSDGGKFSGIFNKSTFMNGDYQKNNSDYDIDISYVDGKPVVYEVVNKDGSKYYVDLTDEDNYLFTYTNGDSYSGNIKNNQKSGEGTYKFSSGETYVGRWSDDLPNGEGIYTCDDYSLSGDFVDGVFTSGVIGFGNDSIKYEIKYHNSELENKVTITTNNYTYSGDYTKEGKISGECSITFSNGDSYHGSISEGRFNGQGRYQWSAGPYYNGYFKDGKLCGQGTYYFGSSDKLIGYFSNNKPSGSCTYYKLGIKYNTYWSNGVMTSISEG